MDHQEVARLRSHALAVAMVAAAAVARVLIGGAGSAPFAFALIAISIAAARGGLAPGSVAALTATVLARLTTPIDRGGALLFAFEGIVLALVVSRLSAALEERSERLAAAESRIRDLQAVERRLRASDAAFDGLERLADGYAAILLDIRGRVCAWRAGAEALFGWQAAQIVGERGSALFAADNAEALFTRLLGDASGGSAGRFTGLQRRADGSEFEADLELRELGEQARDGFVLLVGDRTHENAWRAFADSSAELQAALRDEADVAQRQLATLQHVTDPSVNALPASQAAAALLERLRTAIDADGAALVRVGAFRRRLISVNDRLQEEGVADRRQNDARTPQDDRILVIQNDPARVAALSLVNWPECVSSLMAVPVLAGGVVEGTIEVVGLRSRRSTEWEIALVQVVAARIAGRLQDESYLDADAVA
jgi:PAS domain S-box-containing protein